MSKPESIIISYPRSGLNWIRYCIEYFSEQRTPGLPLLVDNDLPVIVDRTHNVLSKPSGNVAWQPFYDEAGQALYRRAILLLRNHRECYVREAKGDLCRLQALADNILAFEAFEGNKLLVYYEDMLTDFCKVTDILHFLDINTNEKPFDINHHRFASTYCYHKRHKAYTRADPNNFLFHSADLPLTYKENIDHWMEGKLSGTLFNKYLGRYCCDTNDTGGINCNEIISLSK